jgi:hypothetical protein
MIYHNTTLPCATSLQSAPFPSGYLTKIMHILLRHMVHGQPIPNFSNHVQQLMNSPDGHASQQHTAHPDVKSSWQSCSTGVEMKCSITILVCSPLTTQTLLGEGLIIM